MAEVRSEMQRKQQQWLQVLTTAEFKPSVVLKSTLTPKSHCQSSPNIRQERRVEQERLQAEAALGSRAGASRVEADEVLGKITEQITERLQVEVRRENARRLQARYMGKAWARSFQT